MYSSRVFRGCRALMAAAKSTATKPSGGSIPAAPKGILKFLGGIPEASRTDAIKKIWVYIKASRVVTKRRVMCIARKSIETVIDLC
ncbi:hypothetical protein MKX01_020202 [Papaver californicum]|nr:hypothetical protein MKX01_020202 [Papaver californicum]